MVLRSLSLALLMACGGSSQNTSNESNGEETSLPDAPPPPSELVRKAEAEMAEGNFPAAKKSLQLAVAENDKDARAYYDLGIVEEELGNLAEAEAAYRLALNIEQSFTFAAVNLGVLLHQMDRDKEALSFLKKAVEQAPDSAEAHFNLGVVLNSLGETGPALSHHEKATELSPNDMLAWLRVAWLRFSAQDRDGATAAATKAFELSKQETKGRPLAELGSVLRLTGQAEQAVDVLDRALADKTTFATLTPALRAEARAAVYTERGMALSALDRVAAARESYQQAIKQTKAYPLAHYALANLLANQREWKLAIASYEKFIKLSNTDDPNFAKAKAKLKKIREIIGRKSK